MKDSKIIYHANPVRIMAKKEITEKDIHKDIRKILEEHRGMKNKIKSREIAELVGKPSKEDTHSTIRALIKETIHLYRLPVGATGGGYFFLSNEEELTQYKEYLKKKAFETMQRGFDVEKYYAAYHNLDPVDFTTEILPEEED